MGGKAPCRKRVILTRTKEDIERDRVVFERHGFEVIPLPLIRVESIEFEPPRERPDLIIFQSAKAVSFFLERSGMPEGAKVVAVGEKTREILERCGIEVHMVPKEHSAGGLLKELPEGKGELVLIPRSEQGREDLLEGLPKKGYRVIALNVYRTFPVKYEEEVVLRALRGGGFIVFASPSAVKGLFANLQKEKALTLLENLVVVSIGKTTKRELEEFGVAPDLIPPKPLMEEVAGKIHEFWQENCIH